MKTPLMLFTRHARALSLLVGATAGLTVHGLASVIVDDPFDYLSGSSLPGQSGGVGWSGSWSLIGAGAAGTIQSNAFTAPSGYGYSTSSTSLQLTPGTGNVTARRAPSSTINLNPTSTQTYYYSILFSRVDSDPSQSNEVVSFLSMTNSSGQELVRFGTNSSEGLNILSTTNAGSANSVNSAANIYSTGTTFENAAQYLILCKMELNAAGTADIFSMSLYPAAGSVPSSEPAVWTLTMSADLSGTITNFNMAGTVNVGAVNFENFYFGSTYASVVPEPASSRLVVGMLSLGAISFLWRRRTRR
ncbi:hypothetical protein DB345_06245 [Spartobacteria bacterium LR76]|nr:hypothetical protein DB345_06245 [Spartobacteria bacterium LR76]